MGKLAENLRKALASATDEARDAWTAADELKERAAEADLTTDEGKSALAEFEEAIAAYTEKEEACVELREKYERAIDADSKTEPKPLELPDGNGWTKTTRKELDLRTPGDKFVESDAYKSLVQSGSLKTERGRVTSSPVQVWDAQEMKRLLSGKADLIYSGGAGASLLQPDRLAAVVPELVRPIMVLQLVNQSTTSTDTVEWVQVTGSTNAAAEVAEAVDLTTGTKPQSDLTLDLVQSPVATIAHWMAATRQVLADAPRLRDLIDQQLRLGIMMRLETQIIAGNGTAPNLRGILNTPGIGSVGPPVVGPPATTAVDVLYEAIATVRAEFLEPNAVVVNPADWGSIRLAKDTTGNYYYGPPNIAGPETIFGIRVVQSAALPAGSALVGDFSQATLWTREGVVVMASSEHADFFIKNLVAVLAEGRWAFGVTYPQAFCLADLVA